jgi:branched-chain amino acid transport system ATP-binding protein
VTRLLEVDGLRAGYGDLLVLHDLALKVDEGELVAIVGANAAGKTTLLRTIAGFIRPAAGEVRFAGERANGVAPYRLAQRGMAMVGERAVIPRMTVHDNLVLGAYPARGRPHLQESLQAAYELFPLLKDKRDTPAGSLSGGQQQALCIARALMAKPKLLMLDEPSAGLSPVLVGTILKAISELNRQGLTILLVEQNVTQTLKIASRAYVLESGRIVIEGPAQDLLHDDRVKVAYLGM